MFKRLCAWQVGNVAIVEKSRCAGALSPSFRVQGPGTVIVEDGFFE